MSRVHSAQTNVVERSFQQLTDTARIPSLPSRIKFMIEDLLVFRDNGSVKCHFSSHITHHRSWSKTPIARSALATPKRGLMTIAHQSLCLT